LKTQIAKKDQERKKLTEHLGYGGKEGRGEDRDAEIRNLRAGVKKLRCGLELDQDSPKPEGWKKSLHEHDKKLKWLLMDLHERHGHRRRFPAIEEVIERTKRELMEFRPVAEDLRENNLTSSKQLNTKSLREAHLEELTDHLDERLRGGRLVRSEGMLAIFRLKHSQILALGEVIEPFLTHPGVIAMYPPGNALIIRDMPPRLEAAHMIFKWLDVPHETSIHHEFKIDR